MSETNHIYTFHGFPGSYWEKKAARDAVDAKRAGDAERRSARVVPCGICGENIQDNLLCNKGAGGPIHTTCCAICRLGARHET